MDVSPDAAALANIRNWHFCNDPTWRAWVRSWLLNGRSSAGSVALFANEPFGWHEGIGCVLILGAGLVEGINQIYARPRLDVIP